MKTLNSTNVHGVVDGEEVAVWCPIQLQWVPCKVEYIPIQHMKGICITTLDSRVDAYNDDYSNGRVYGEYIKHLRGNGLHAAVMSRDAMAKLLDSREYSLR